MCFGGHLGQKHRGFVKGEDSKPQPMLGNPTIEQTFKINISRLLNGYEIFFAGNENLLKLGGGDGCTTL